MFGKGSAPASQQIAGLLSGAGDIGIMAPPQDDVQDLRGHLFCMQELMLTVSRDHALGRQAIQYSLGLAYIESKVLRPAQKTQRMSIISEISKPTASTTT
jgi:DNA-binding transcriptional LysR family regulator